MNLLAALLFGADLLPLAFALRANRRTTLRQPLAWASLAWAAWTSAALSRAYRPEVEGLNAYVALCLTGCAGIAVLGARRPGVSAWNFVLVGLLAVLLLPIVNGWGELRLETPQAWFLAATWMLPLLNYLPTRLGLGILLIGAGCGLETARLLAWITPESLNSLGFLLVALGPWVAWASLARSDAARTAFDRLWLTYRDRFGFVWSQRMREQFNRAAHHAGWPVMLHWQGLRATANAPTPDPAALLEVLHAVLKRFRAEDDDAHEGTQ